MVGFYADDKYEFYNRKILTERKEKQVIDYLIKASIKVNLCQITSSHSISYSSIEKY
jgi:hypothetical protein